MKAMKNWLHTKGMTNIEIALVGDGNEIEDDEESIRSSCTSQLNVVENKDVFVSTAEQEIMHDDAIAESDNTPSLML